MAVLVSRLVGDEHDVANGRQEHMAQSGDLPTRFPSRPKGANKYEKKYQRKYEHENDENEAAKKATGLGTAGYQKWISTARSSIERICNQEIPTRATSRLVIS
jgi:hypothetical protein